MKKLIISGVFCSVLMLGGFQVASAEETTTTTSTSNAAMLAKIQDLMKLIADLQAKLADVRGEVKELVKELSVGAEGDDVKEIQEILASDPSLFGVKPTGYYGPLTEAAIEKFQERYGLPVTGIVDEATLEVMKELKMEKKNGMVPAGLVKSEEVKDRIKARLQAKWGDCVWGEKFRASNCKKGHGDKDDEDEEENDDEDDTEVTRDDARRAVVDAQNELNQFRDSIEDMEDDDATDEEIDEAEDTLKEAQDEMADARKAFYKQDYDEALDAAEEVIDILEGDDSDDDEDEDDEDDEDEDEDDEDEDDE